MDMRLVRDQRRSDGIFSIMSSADGSLTGITLEHSYQMLGPELAYEAKLVNGIYVCKRGTGAGPDGMHRLHDGVWFDTFEVMDVPDFRGKKVTGLLWHHGNFQEDSDGCILTGKTLGWRLGGLIRMITWSDQTFKAFMKVQEGVDQFQLTVE